jgi:hypothetical protein
MVTEVTECMLARPSIPVTGFEPQMPQDLRRRKAHNVFSEASAHHRGVPCILAVQGNDAYSYRSPVLRTPWSCQTCVSEQFERIGRHYRPSHPNASGCALDE